MIDLKMILLKMNHIVRDHIHIQTTYFKTPRIGEKGASYPQIRATHCVRKSFVTENW